MEYCNPPPKPHVEYLPRISLKREAFFKYKTVESTFVFSKLTQSLCGVMEDKLHEEKANCRQELNLPPMALKTPLTDFVLYKKRLQLLELFKKLLFA